MEKITITLKQHTPLLHFQSTQDGATLRASEVKPKLDKFILTKLGKGSLSDILHDSKFDLRVLKYLKLDALSSVVWESFDEYKQEDLDDLKSEVLEELDLNSQIKYETYISGQENRPSFEDLDFIEKGRFRAASLGILINEKKHKALNYKMRICSEGINFRCTYSICGSGEDSNIDGIKSYYTEKDNEVDGSNIVITSIHKIVINLIEKYIFDFFACVNFGRRGNKGFGCFTVRETVYLRSIKFKIKDFKEALIRNFGYYYHKDIAGSDSDIPSNINYDYNILKAGFNPPSKDPKAYTKSKMFSWLKKQNEIQPRQNVRWEKRFLKKIILSEFKDLNEDFTFSLKNTSGKDNYAFNSNEEYVYARVILGMAYHFDFQVAANDIIDNIHVSVNIKDRDHHIVDRYQSPIQFIPYGNNHIFVVVNTNNYLNNSTANFDIIAQKFNNYTKKKDTVGSQYTTREISILQLNIKDFMTFALTEGSDKNNDKILGYKLFE